MHGLVLTVIKKGAAMYYEARRMSEFQGSYHHPGSYREDIFRRYHACRGLAAPNLELAGI